MTEKKLTDEELKQVSGGEELEHNYTVFACNKCGFEVKWPGTNYQCWGDYGIHCDNCGCNSFRWVRVVD